MSTATHPPATPQLGRGMVRHTRLRPVHHAFTYPATFLMLPMRQLRAQPCEALRRNQRAWFCFHDRDHGDGRADALAWLEELLLQHGVEDIAGEIWLHTLPRVGGAAFKPVSFWYVHRADGRLRAVVVEVNNTFGERHCYLLDGPEVAYGVELSARKVMHVSPFCEVTGRYRFRFLHTQRPDERPRTVVRIDHDDDHGPLLQTSISGHLHPLSARAIRDAVWASPWMSVLLVLRIHWQALQLWLRRVPWFRQPAPPSSFTTR